MALLRLDVAGFSDQINAGDVEATRIFQAMLKRRRFDVDTMSGGEQIGAALEIIVDFIQSEALMYEEGKAARAARDAVADAPPEWVGG